MPKGVWKGSGTCAGTAAALLLELISLLDLISSLGRGGGFRGGRGGGGDHKPQGKKIKFE